MKSQHLVPKPRSTIVSATAARREIQAKLNLAGVAGWPITQRSFIKKLGAGFITENLFLVGVANLTAIPADVAAIATDARGYEVAFHHDDNS